MEQSLEYQLPLKTPRSWVREVPAVAGDGPRIAFALLLLFLVMLYSNVAVIYKQQLDALRPTLVVALGALSMMVVELSQTRRSFSLSWPQGALLLGLFGVCVASTFTAIYISHALDQTTDFAKMILIYVLIENVVTNEARLKKVMYVMVLGGLFPALGTISHYQAGILQENSRAAWRGIFGNPNEAAYGILILVPIALALAGKARLPVRIALWGIIGIYMVGIFFTFSRGGFLALGVVVGLMAWKHKSILIKVGMLGGLIGGAVLIGMFWTRSSGGFNNIKQDTSFNERIMTFQAGGLMFLHNPLLGVGPGDSMVAYPLYVPMPAHCRCHDQLIVHNSFIQALGELGALGFTPFVLFLCVAIYQAWKMERGPLGSYAMALELAMWGFMVCSLSGGFTYTWWPYILAGLITAAKRIVDSETAEISPRGAHAV